MKIAKPLLLTLTPIGVIGGLHEAWRLVGGLTFLIVVDARPVELRGRLGRLTSFGASSEALGDPP